MRRRTLSARAGNAAIVTGWLLYVKYLLTRAAQPPLAKESLIAIALVGLWVPALINLNGVSKIAAGKWSPRC